MKDFKIIYFNVIQFIELYHIHEEMNARDTDFWILFFAVCLKPAGKPLFHLKSIELVYCSCCTHIVEIDFYDFNHDEAARVQIHHID